MEIMRSQQNPAADWSDLPPELLQLMAGKLVNIRDYIRFRCVCPSWRSAAGPADHIHQFLPWLIYARRTDSTIISFRNIADSRTCKFNLPEVQGKWIYGSSHGWLVMLSPSVTNQSPGPTAASLLNPVTRVDISLPGLPESLLWSNSTKALLCSHPLSSRPREPLVVVWNYASNTLAMFSQGDNDWIGFSSSSSTVEFGDIAYFNGALYTTGLDGRLAVLDVATLALRQLVEPHPPDIVTNYKIDFNLVESAGDLLLIPRYYEISDQRVNHVAFVFKLDMNGKPGWKWATVVADGNGSSSLFSCSMCNFQATSPNFPDQYTGQQVYSIPQVLIPGVVDGIITGKFHYCRTWKRATWLVPSLH